MIPLLAIIIFMMNFFSSLQVWEGARRAGGSYNRSYTPPEYNPHKKSSAYQCRHLL